MAIPSYSALFRPLLACFAADGQEHHVRELYDRLGEEFGLTADDRAVPMPSGQGPLFLNRIGWARTYLKKAGLIETVRRGFHRITDRGRRALIDCPETISTSYLAQFPEFAAFTGGERRDEAESPVAPEAPTYSQLSPEEVLISAHQTLRRGLAAELLERTIGCSPAFFETLVVRVLVAMGYGGSVPDAGRAIGRSGDEGIDGVIKEDRLGLDVIYLQAKRWAADRSVGRREIQQFVGALQGKRARRGVFITTSSFTTEAREYVRNVESMVVLIDGALLAELMIDSDVGVTPFATYTIKRIDSDFFAED